MATETRAMDKREAQQPQGVERTMTRKVFMPRADIYESGESLVILLDMPGVDEKSVDVTLEKDILTITGTVQPHIPEGHTLAYSEYEIGDYRRAFTISDVDRENITAVVKNGVLRLTLPKSAQARTRKIEVKTQ
ncbi:MAG TPA: Hsp20/alpha crystallin family protein [Planctomycetota bacterium]|nr:Hsp20/alpha crystallin family protein [Planctomycetota bacterium]